MIVVEEVEEDLHQIAFLFVHQYFRESFRFPSVECFGFVYILSVEYVCDVWVLCVYGLCCDMCGGVDKCPGKVMPRGVCGVWCLV